MDMIEDTYDAENGNPFRENTVKGQRANYCKEKGSRFALIQKVKKYLILLSNVFNDAFDIAIWLRLLKNKGNVSDSNGKTQA
ncbi:unnamed protein product [Brugia timori]|uniref:Tnp_DDE_dom domain-containing protein n=1 Tax=Brugia timori TaxID=42155 RepID=A0A0R3QYN3_9BILA|nr:unnamed protein product [Brugia timori]